MTTRFDTFATPRAGARASLIALVGLAGRRLRTAFLAWKNRRDMLGYVATMDDRMLADIGVTRSDVRSAMAEPLWSDPTVRLRLLAVERRAARRGAARERLGGTTVAPVPGRPTVPATRLSVSCQTC